MDYLVLPKRESGWSYEVQGLVVQGNTLVETIEIAKDVAKKLFYLKGNT